LLKNLLCAAALMVAVSGGASAQSFPQKPIQMVIPFAAGGPTDLLGRVMAERMSQTIGQTVIVENVTGAGGMLGAQKVAQAKPDGYTFVLGTVGTHAVNQTLYKKPLYNAASDFEPVALVAEVPLVLVTRKDLPANNLQEFIAYAKKQNGKLQFGATTGSTGHLDCSQFNSEAGIKATLVPYRGGGLTMPDLIAGRTDYVCTLSATAKPQIEGKLVKTLAIFTLKRSPILPDVPTADEQGLKNFETTTWFSLMLPKGTSPEIVKKLHDASVAALDKPAIQEGMKQVGASIFPPEHRTPEYLAKFTADEIRKKAEIIKAAGLTAE